MIRMHATSAAAAADARQHTLQPVVTGTSVLGIVCADGVLMAADTLGDARFPLVLPLPGARKREAALSDHRVTRAILQVRTAQWRATGICGG